MNTHFIAKSMRTWDEDELVKRLDGKPELLSTSEASMVLGWVVSTFPHNAKMLGVEPRTQTIMRPMTNMRGKFYSHEDILTLNRRNKDAKGDKHEKTNPPVD